MPTEVTDIAVRARIDSFVTEMQKIPGVSKKEISAATKAMEKAWKLPDVDKEAKEKFGKLKKAATVALGGVVGDVEDVVGAFGTMTPASAIAVGAIAAVGAAAVGAAAGAASLERKAAEAIDRLDKLGQSDMISDEQRAQVEQANAALDAVGVAIDAVTISLGSGLAPVVVTVATELAELVLFVDKVIGAFDVGSLTINSWTSLLGAAVVGGITPFMDGLLGIHRMLGTNTDAMEGWVAGLHETGRALADDAIAIHDDTEAQKAQNRESTDASALIEELAAKRKADSAAAKIHADALRKAEQAQRELTKAYEAELDALDRLGQIGQRANEDRLDAVDRLTVAYDEQVAEIWRLADQAQASAEARGASELELAEITAQAVAAEADVTSRYLRDREQAHLEMAEQAINAEQRVADATATNAEGSAEAAEAVTQSWAEQHAEQLANIDEELAKYQMYWEAIHSAIDDAADLSTRWHEHKIEQLLEERAAITAAAKAQGRQINEVEQADQKAINERIARHKKAAMFAYRATQAAAIVSAVIDGARAAVALVPAFAYLGPGAPAAAGAAAGLSVAAATAAILSEPPPKFHTGYAPDEMTITRGELGGILTPRGQQQLGGPRAIEAANRGELDGGGRGAQPTYTTVHVMDNRVMGRVVTRTVAADRAVRDELRKLERRPVGRGHYSTRSR